MNRAAQQLGRLGGLATSEAKRRANRAKIKTYWADVRAGKIAAPKHTKRRMPNAEVSDGGPLTYESPAAQSRRSLH